jgi:glycosyltransferase involved in cell wall biosynthesis
VRILVISDLYPPVAFGGYESETAALVDGLRDRHEVLVLTSVRGRSSAPADANVRRELPYVGPRRREAFRAPVAAARAAKITRGAIAVFDPELVYVANSVAIPQTAPLVAASSGLPLVYRLSELFMASSLYTGDRFLRSLLPGQTGARAALATAMRLANRHPALRLDPSAPGRAAISWASNALREHVEMPDSIEAVLERTIHPATTQEAAFTALERSPSPQPTVLFLGRMTTAKGIEVAYRALTRVREQHAIDAKLLLVGSATAEMSGRLDDLAAELGITDAIDVRGHLDTDALAAVLAQAGVLVLPTVEWDVFPLVLIEAGLARVPIVAARIGGVPEAVTDGEHALLFEPGDVAACADAIAAVLRDPGAAGVRAARAHERMRELSVARYRRESERFIVDAAEALS